MRSLLPVFLISRKVIFVGIVALFFISHAMADDCILPSHDEIKTEVASLIEFDQLEKSKANVLQKVKKCVLLSNDYIEITAESAPKIYQLIETAAKTIGVEVPSKVYLNIGHSLLPNCCDAVVVKSRGGLGEIYLSVGSKFLCELMPQESRAILEFQFMLIKDKLLEKLAPKMLESDVLRVGIAGAWAGCSFGAFRLVGSLFASLVVNKSRDIFVGEFVKHLDEVLVVLAATSLIIFLSWCIDRRLLVNSDEIFCLSKEIGKHADLNVSSKSDLAAGLKKISAMLTIEGLKYYPNKIDKNIISLLESDINNALMKNIEDKQLDSFDPFHSSLQARLAYLKEASGPSETNGVQATEDCGPSVVA